MFTSYVKIAFRVIFRNKGYSFINIAGLAVGMACSMLILLWVQDELSYDRFHTNADHLYRVEEDQFYSGKTFHVTVTPHPVGPAFKEEIPEIIDATRFSWMGSLLFRHGENVFYESDIRATDPSTFQMFSFPFLKGDPLTAFSDPHSLVITREMAEKHFADIDPIGEVVTINNQYAMTITGVLENIPHNSSIRFDMLVPYEFMKVIGRYSDSWGSNSILTVVQLPGPLPAEPINAKMTELVHSRTETDTEFVLFPYTDLHLHSYFGFNRAMGAIRYVYIFSVIALFVLFIACINFMNLSTARSAKRAREIGMRKAVGALRRQIAWQFLGESMLLSTVALFFAVVLVAALLAPFNTLSGKAMTLDVLFSGRFLLGMVGITFLTGLVAGSYPALFLSSFQPVKVLKGSLSAGTRHILFRRVLVVVQFSLSIFLIIGTFIIYNQLTYMQDKSLGYDKDHLVYVQMNDDIRASYETLKSAWSESPMVEGVTATGQRPSQIGSNAGGAEWEGKDPEQDVLIGYNVVNFDFVETMKIEMAEGRSFSEDFPSDVTLDTTGAFLVNEAVAALMGKETVVGEDFSFMGVEGKIIGVMKNFHYQSVRSEIQPMAFLVYPEWFRFILIRVKPDNITQSIDFLSETWSQFVPEYPFDYHFLDEDFDRMYRTEERLSELIMYFAFMAVFIASLGLFGLALFTAEQRRGEIGIRKVLGASHTHVALLLCKEFLILVGLANLIAWPVAWYVMNGWLEDFAYRTTPGLEVFVFSGALALIIALGTVSFQAIKAALANPVDSLRYE